VAVGAHDLAGGDLIEHLGPGPVTKTDADAEPLLPDVVELEDDRVVLVTVGARVLREVVE
jgi:hypothetical protein